MGGFFAAVSKADAVLDVFFGVDYHSHLGTYRAGMASWSAEAGFQRDIHNIENASFRSKFEQDVRDMRGSSVVGCISDTDPQPILIRSHLGTYAIVVTGRVGNLEELTQELLNRPSAHFGSMGGGRVNSVEVVAALIDQCGSFAEGIRYAQSRIEGSATILILDDKGRLIAARDRLGRLPVQIGAKDDGYCLSFESFAFLKLGYREYRQLGPGECVSITAEGVETLTPPGREEHFCAFLWTYYGYPASRYEGDSIEEIRYRGGSELARADLAAGRCQSIDFVCGVPDSGLAYAIGYAAESRVPFSRPFIKYTPTWPRSFMPDNQRVRSRIAKMKLLPVPGLIEGKKLLFIDDSIVRGTQIREMVDFFYQNGAKEVHMRSACPPIAYSCPYLNFSRNRNDMELLLRRLAKTLEGEVDESKLMEYSDGGTERGRAFRQAICKRCGFVTLDFQTLDGLLRSIGLPKEKICTYCWTGEGTRQGNPACQGGCCHG